MSISLREVQLARSAGRGTFGRITWGFDDDDWSRYVVVLMLFVRSGYRFPLFHILIAQSLQESISTATYLDWSPCKAVSRESGLSRESGIEPVWKEGNAVRCPAVLRQGLPQCVLNY